MAFKSILIMIYKLTGPSLTLQKAQMIIPVENTIKNISAQYLIRLLSRHQTFPEANNRLSNKSNMAVHCSVRSDPDDHASIAERMGHVSRQWGNIR